jgi:hypothetical protein
MENMREARNCSAQRLPSGATHRHRVARTKRPERRRVARAGARIFAVLERSKIGIPEQRKAGREKLFANLALLRLLTRSDA